jgi:hypothetical protein
MGGVVGRIARPRAKETPISVRPIPPDDDPDAFERAARRAHDLALWKFSGTLTGSHDDLEILRHGARVARMAVLDLIDKHAAEANAHWREPEAALAELRLAADVVSPPSEA